MKLGMAAALAGGGFLASYQITEEYAHEVRTTLERRRAVPEGSTVPAA